MSAISVIAFIIAAHSIAIVLLIVVNPNWYYTKAIAAGVTPNPQAAIGVPSQQIGASFAP